MNEKWLVDKSDFTFSTTTGDNSRPYGIAWDCINDEDCFHGEISIDLHNTGFFITPGLEYKAAGWMSGIVEVSISDTREVVRAT